MKKTIIIFTFILFFCGFFALPASQDCPEWSLGKAENVKDNESLLHFAWDATREPLGPLDRITLHRVVKKDRLLSTGKEERVIFLIPGTWNAGGWVDNITDPDINTLLYLAVNDYDVYTIDFRSANIPDLEYQELAEQGIDVSCSTDWNYGVYREDLKACVDRIKAISKIDKIFMGGFSKGVYHMFFYASKYQEDLRGLVVLDGNFKKYPPDGTPLDEATYNMVVSLFKNNQLVNPQTGDLLPWLEGIYFLSDNEFENWRLAGILPNTKRLVGQQLPSQFGCIADYVADNAFNLWNPFLGIEGVLTNYHNGSIDRDVLVKALNTFNRHYPYIQTLEDSQLDAYVDVPYLDYDDNEVFLPAIAFMSRLMCPQGVCLLDFFPSRTKSDDVTINYYQDYGHLDILYGKKSLQDVKQPLLEWLNLHVDKKGNSAATGNPAPQADNVFQAFFKECK